ncbi:hypothetical protein K1719_018523 [Acacia pycnantha]|nr:hypothetical protein K1719_018523 [Acacia pycnantha]
MIMPFLLVYGFSASDSEASKLCRLQSHSPISWETMTSNNSVRDDEIILQAAKDGKWRKVLKMYEEKKDLRTVKIPSKGDTVLHMAVSNGELDTVGRIVYLVCQKGSNEQAADENGDEKSLVFGAQNDIDSSIITRGNNDGETPLFLAALHGNKEAFLWLHHNSPQDSSSRHAPYKRDDNDTILHCAIEGGHIDVGIEIVRLYEHHQIKDMMTRNKNGLSPLHFLAATPSIFESTDLPSRFFVVRLLYFLFKCQLLYLWLFKCKPYVDGLVKFRSILNPRAERLRCCIETIWLLIVSPLRILAAAVLVVLLLITSPANWFYGIRKMKENHAWSLQILEILLQHASDEDESLITSGTPFQPPSTSAETIEDNEAGSIIIDSPLRIAAENGVIEMVEKILKHFPSGINDLDDERKNIVLLAAEKRQTKLYQFLRDYHKGKPAFSKVDKDGNTALHLAAKPGINLYGQTTTMIEEFKWFEFVKSSVPYTLWEGSNKEGKTAEEIFRDSYKEHMTSDRKWLDQTSQTCSVASTLVAGMAFSNFAGENFERKNDASLVALSLSLTSTISFLAILAFRSQSLVFWKYVPFMLQIAILTMFGSIVALWISLFHGQSITTCAILGSPIAILTIVSLPIFIGPTVMSMFNEVPPLTETPPQMPSSAKGPRKRKMELIRIKSPLQTLHLEPMILYKTLREAPMKGSRRKQMKEALQVLINDMLEMEAQLKDAYTSPAKVSVLRNSNMATKGGNLLGARASKGPREFKLAPKSSSTKGPRKRKMERI